MSCLSHSSPALAVDVCLRSCLFLLIPSRLLLSSQVLAEGRLEEARQLCAEQVDTALARLASDAACRAEYFKLWEVQRKAPVVLPSAAVDDADEPAASAEEARAGAAKGGLGRGNKAAAAAAEEAAEAPVEPAKKAEAVIAAVLEEAQEELRRSKAAADAAAAAQAAAEAAAAHAATAAVPVAVRESVEGAAAEAKPRARPPRAPKHSAPAVEPVVLPEDNFELPEAVRLKGKVGAGASGCACMAGCWLPVAWHACGTQSGWCGAGSACL